MSKEDRTAKITALEEKLKSKVICFLTSDRTNAGVPITRDCTKVLQQHLDINDNWDTLSLLIVSHGGDMDVPWEMVSLLRSHGKKLQAVIPYVCHSAATMIAIGCDEQIVGPRGQLSPTDPTLTVKTGTGADAPTVSFGVEDINAFIEFIRDTLRSSFSKHAHEALGKLIDRVQPEFLGSINRTYFRNKLLIEKMLRLSKRKYTVAAIEKIVDHLTVAYYSHQHGISRAEMEGDLKLPIVQAESLDCDGLIWQLYEAYASEFQSRKPFDAQAEFQASGQNPLTVKLKSKYIESLKRTDVYVQAHVIAGTGVPNFQFTTPQITGVAPEVVQEVFNYFAAELQRQLKPLQVAKIISSSGEWETE